MAEMTKAAREKALSKAYNTASQTLRETHRDEFNKLYQEAAEALGVEWSPRLSPLERASQQMDTLLDEFPELRERLTQPDPAQAPPAS